MKTHKIRWTKQAEEQFTKEVSSLARFQKETAKTLFRRIKEAVSQLREFPKIGRVVPELKNWESENALLLRIGSYM